jgi:type I restriction enzyme S subunit
MKTLDEYIKNENMKKIEALVDYNLPNGWKWVKIRDVVMEFQSGFPCSKTHVVKEGIPHLRPNNIGFYGVLDLSEVVFIPPEMADLNTYSLKKGDVLFNNTNSKELVGRASLVKEDLNYTFSNHITRLRVNNKLVTPEWLSWSINYLWLKGYFLKICRKWVGQAGVNTTMLKLTKIPLPPLEEQKRIVSRLELLISRAEGAKRLRKLAREEAEKIMHAALNKVFSRAEEKGWERVKIGKIVSLQKGKKPSKLFNEKIEGSVPYLTAQYMRGLEEPEYCLKTDDIILTEEKDVLIIMDGSYSGDTFIGFNGALASTMAKFLFNKSIILPEYLYYFLRNNFEILNTKTKGAAIPHVRKDVLFNLQVPLPPLEEQKRIIVYFDKLRETIESIRGLQQKTEEELEKLVPSILDKAFRGEL